MIHPAHILEVTQDNFETEVLLASNQQPVLIDFWAGWCAPCQQLKPILEKLANEYAGAFRLVKIDADQETTLASMFGVRSLPTVLLLKDGKPLDGFMGARPESEVRKFLAGHGIQPNNTSDEPVATTASPTPAANSESPSEALSRITKAIEAEPDRDELKLDLATAQMSAGQTEAAAATLDDLPANLANDLRARRLHKQLEFVDALAGAPDAATLEQRIAADSKDFEARDLRAIRRLLDGQSEQAVEDYLALLTEARSWSDGLAKKRLLALFTMIDDAPLLSKARQRMASLLF